MHRCFVVFRGLKNIIHRCFVVFRGLKSIIHGCSEQFRGLKSIIHQCFAVFRGLKAIIHRCSEQFRGLKTVIHRCFVVFKRLKTVFHRCIPIFNGLRGGMLRGEMCLRSVVLVLPLIYSKRMVLAGLILVIRKEGPSIMAAVASSVQMFRSAHAGRVRSMGTASM